MSPEDDDFQVTLISNASLRIYPDNKAQKFKTELTVPLNLSGKWQVGILDIQIPVQWYTITEQTMVTVEVFGIESGFQVEVIFPPGKFHAITAILETFCEIVNIALNSDLDHHSGKIFAKYDSSIDQIKITYEGLGSYATITLESNSPLARILGISKDESGTVCFSTPITNEYPTNLDLVQSVFIFCDIVKPQLVGDTWAQLIGIAPIQSQTTDMIYWVFNPIMYRPVSQVYIKDIEIQLCSIDSQIIPIRNGNTIVRLNFRKVKGGDNSKY